MIEHAHLISDVVMAVGLVVMGVGWRIIWSAWGRR